MTTQLGWPFGVVVATVVALAGWWALSLRKRAPAERREKLSGLKERLPLPLTLAYVLLLLIGMPLLVLRDSTQEESAFGWILRVSVPLILLVVFHALVREWFTKVAVARGFEDLEAFTQDKETSTAMKASYQLLLGLAIVLPMTALTLLLLDTVLN